MKRLHSFLEGLIGLRWEYPLPVTKLNLIPATAEPIMSGGYLEPQALKNTLEKLWAEYRRIYLVLQDSMDKLNHLRINLPISPEVGINLIDTTARELDRNLDWRHTLEGDALWLLHQYHAMENGAICWDTLGFFKDGRVELFIPVIRKVADEFRLYAHDLSTIIACYWLVRALLQVGLDKEGRRWEAYEQVDGELIHALGLYYTEDYCRTMGGSLARSFQVLIQATGCQHGIWLGLREQDKDKLRIALQFARQSEDGITLMGFQDLIAQLDQLK